MIQLSPRAGDQREDRATALAWVEANCAYPERTEQDPFLGRTRLFWPIPKFGGRVLRVVVDRKDFHVEVVIARFDRVANQTNEKTMMKMHLDPEADAFAVRFAPKGTYVESEEVAPGVVLDFDANRQVISVEEMNVPQRTAAPVPTDAPEAQESPVK